jgi:hypothetical protein
MSMNIEQGADKVLSKSDKSSAMSDMCLSENDKTFARKALHEAFPKERHGSVFAAQCEAYSFLLRQRLEKKITMRRVRALWEGKAQRIDGEEKDALRRAKIEEAKRERNALRQRLSDLDQELAFLDT